MTFGSYSMFRQMKPTSRWKDPAVPECDPNWVVRFRFGDGSVLTRAAREGPARFPVCERCRAVPVGENPVELRSGCECQRRARRWAESFLETQGDLYQRREFERLEAMRRAPKVNDPMEVLAAFLQRGPADARARVGYLRAMIEQTLGGTMEGQFKARGWELLNESLVRDWSELRQEAGWRGWLGLGAGANMPEDGWDLLRVELAAGRLPPPGLTGAERRRRMQPMPWNTSIKGYLNKAQGIFGEKSRREFLRGLVVPELAEFRAVRLGLLKVPKGHRAMTKEQRLALLEAGDALKGTDLRLWVIHEALSRMGLRPIELWQAHPGWVEAVGDGDRLRRRLVIKNRPDEGFEVKNDEEGAIWIPDELAAAMDEVGTPVSLIGGATRNASKNLVERTYSKWMRETAEIEGKHTCYLWRHMTLAERRTSSGGAASAALGRHSEAVNRAHYSAQLATVEPLSDEEVLRAVV